jgi:hypothetical protein
MASTCEDIVCSTSCAAELPATSFSICAPNTNFGQIAKIYIANDGYPLTDENDLAEWQARAALAQSDPARIMELSVIGDHPLPAANEIPLSRGRITNGAKDRVINLTIDETNQTNYEMMRAFECGKTVRAWYETYGGLLYGGTEGILGSITLGEVITANTTELITFQGTFKWKSKFSPCRTESPMAGIDLVEEAGS